MESVKQKRTSHDGVEYTALLDEEKRVLIDGEDVNEFCKNDPYEFYEIENHVELMKDIFEERDDNEIQTENGTPYEVYWDTYMGHYIIVERRIEL